MFRPLPQHNPTDFVRMSPPHMPATCTIEKGTSTYFDSCRRQVLYLLCITSKHFAYHAHRTASHAAGTKQGAACMRSHKTANRPCWRLTSCILRTPRLFGQLQTTTDIVILSSGPYLQFSTPQLRFGVRHSQHSILGGDGSGRPRQRGCAIGCHTCATGSRVVQRSNPQVAAQPGGPIAARMAAQCYGGPRKWGAINHHTGDLRTSRSFHRCTHRIRGKPYRESARTLQQQAHSGC